MSKALKALKIAAVVGMQIMVATGKDTNLQRSNDTTEGNKKELPGMPR
jgi:hypothetical protein